MTRLLSLRGAIILGIFRGYGVRSIV